MSKSEAVSLNTIRLVLRKRKEDDIPYMVKLFNNENVRKYLGGYPPRDEHTMLKIVRARKETDWHVVLKENDQYIGECSLCKIVDGFLGEIGYIFMEEYWGKSYAYEAVHEMISYCFNTLKLGRLYAIIEKENNRSRKMIERLGFQLDAIIPRTDFGGRVADVAYYSFEK